MWTHFWDMHSGGGTKVVRLADGSFIDGDRFTNEGQPINHVYIEAPEAEARVIFYNRFGHSPERVSCTCCGGDYSIDDNESLERLTAFHRNCKFLRVEGEQGGGHYVEEGDAERYWATYQTLEEYMNNADVLFIPATHIKPEERNGEVPEQGFVWAD